MKGAFAWTMVMLTAAQCADANDLKRLYDLALARDTTLQAAQFQRDALIEARPQPSPNGCRRSRVPRRPCTSG